MRSDGPTHGLDYYDTHAILCAEYYTSRWILYIMLHTTNLKASWQMHFIACSQVRSEVHSWLHSIAHSQPAWLHAPKYTPSTLPSSPPSTFSRTLPGIPSRTLLVAPDGTLPACLTVRSQVSSQDALKHTPEHALKYTPNCTRWHSQPVWLHAPK